MVLLSVIPNRHTAAISSIPASHTVAVGPQAGLSLQPYCQKSVIELRPAGVHLYRVRAAAAC